MTEKKEDQAKDSGYNLLLSDISGLLEQARRTTARAINSLLTAAYWQIGQRIVEYEQGGKSRAAYGTQLLARLSKDLSSRYGRGFSERNIEQMRAFYLGWEISQTPSAKSEAHVRVLLEKNDDSSIRQTVSAESPSRLSSGIAFKPGQLWKGNLTSSDIVLTDVFPLSWSHYVSLMAVEKPRARAFYESEAIRGGWSVRQLDRQIGTQYFERAVQAKNPQAVMSRALVQQPQDIVPVEEEIRDPYLLEFLNLKDEYSETDLEKALIHHLECFLLEMGTGFTFVARQKRIRIGDSWYRIDLLLYHRGLKCLVVIDLKTGKFTHADAGQMNLYLNYARDHLMMPGEADPIGIILCSGKDDAVVKYATGDIKTRVFASKYLTYLPDEETLRREIMTTQRVIKARLKEEMPHE